METRGGARGRPNGTVSFLFTDVVGSTPLWEREPAAMELALERHDTMLRNVIAEHDGFVFSTGGDAFCVAFHTPSDAIHAALFAQRQLHDEEWPSEAPIRVRMGLHVGSAQERNRDYFGTVVNRAARLMGLAQGGQVVLSSAMEKLVSDDLPNGVWLQPLGDVGLRGMSRAESVFQLSAPGLPTDFAPIASNIATPSNVTMSATALLGRDHDVDALLDTLGRERVLTLVGPGGIGKTTLATEIARRSLDRFPGGVWVLELAPLHESTALVATLASVIGAQAADISLLESVIELLATGPTLLLVDNCEHLVEPVADLVQQLLVAPTLTVLATSRVPLHLRDERIWAVEPLAHHGADSAAVDLFTHHASRVRRDFSLSEYNVDEVEAICRLVEGMPLAVELAAARCRTMPPSDILHALQSDAGRVLRGTRRDVDQRQRTLAATIGWSVDLLSREEQELFARCATFAGSFDLVAAETVCAGGNVDELEIIDLLDGLVDQSMITLVERQGLLTARYRLLEPIRQFALTLPVERDELTVRHARHFARLADEGWRGLFSEREAEWIERLEADSPNHRVAYHHSADRGDLTRALTIAIALNQLGELALQRPFGAELLFDAIQLDGVEQHPLGAVALAQAGVARSRRQDPGSAQLGDRAIALARTPIALVESRLWRASTAIFEGDMDAVRAHALEAVAISRSGADDWLHTISAALAATACALLGNLEETEQLIAELPNHANSSMEQTMVAMARSRHATMTGKTADAYEHAQQAVDYGLSTGNRWSVNTALLTALSPAIDVLSPAELLETLATAIPGWRQANDLARLAQSLAYAAHVLSDFGSYELAAKLTRDAPSHQPPERNLLAALVPILTEQLGQATFERQRELGEATPVRELADEALERIRQLHSG